MKKLLFFALSAISAATITLPAAAMAEHVPVHAVPKPAAATPLEGNNPALSTVGGAVVKCAKVKGNAVWASTTTGTLNLAFEGNCIGMLGGVNVACENIVANGLPFHLLTLPGKAPGVLVTPPAGGRFTEFVCGGIFKFVVEGNGVIGTITEPKCGEEAAEATIKFEKAAVGVQKHKKVEGTEVEYHLTANAEEAALEATVNVKFPAKTLLECT